VTVGARSRADRRLFLTTEAVVPTSRKEAAGGMPGGGMEDF
jgi:hypothetical protein